MVQCLLDPQLQQACNCKISRRCIPNLRDWDIIYNTTLTYDSRTRTLHCNYYYTHGSELDHSRITIKEQRQVHVKLLSYTTRPRRVQLPGDQNITVEPASANTYPIIYRKFITFVKIWKFDPWYFQKTETSSVPSVFLVPRKLYSTPAQ